MTPELNARVGMLVSEIESLLSDVTQQAQDAYLEVLKFKTHAALDVQAYTDAQNRLREIEKLFIKLTITKEEYD